MKVSGLQGFRVLVLRVYPRPKAVGRAANNDGWA